jgi:hypothetical protein
MANLRKVQPGDPLAIPADTFNAFVDAATDLAARRHNQARAAGPGGADGTVLVRNDSGNPRPQRLPQALILRRQPVEAMRSRRKSFKATYQNPIERGA